ncbi:glycosyltransferase family 1 protein [Cercophora newfieldiana]|uniref:UDP-N-acetylglucosamine transferase subunit ALG14 n=1 Tax=Cercophora newfieldiana TaxID=92897 RepID=A0AA40CU49_9PEZI|nr:glycosyltransferase family 1 protein [Cercophora newfieldiana]
MAPVIRSKAAMSCENAPSNLGASSSILDDTTNQPSTEHAVSTTQPATITLPTESQATKQSFKPEDKMLELFDVFGEDDFAVAFFFWLAMVLLGVLATLFFVSLSWITAAASVFCGFILFRHKMLKHDCLPSGRRWMTISDPNAPAPDTDSLPAVYFLYVLGSGGHSAEMIETIKQKFRGQKNQHRRYIITTGDKSSQNMIASLESTISDAYPDERAGTRDVFLIKRARAVHQPLWTAPFTCLMSAAHAVNALTREPNLRPFGTYGYQFKYPHVIITNGPATGLIVGMVAHLLKIFYLVPPHRLKIVYIESWAKTKTLSLTGRLFYWTGIANMFCVQHQTLARSIPDAQFVGAVTARVTPVG